MDRVAIITGGSRGLGRATAELLAREGARVAITYRWRRQDAESVAAGILARGGDALALFFDLESLDSVRAAADAVMSRWGRTDVLVNNAVIWREMDTTPPVRFEHLAADHWQHLISANVDGPFALVQAVLPSMRAGGWGRIVNVSSIAAIEGMRGFGWYPVAKAALLGLTRTLAAELSSVGILTNTVVPGPMLTEQVQARSPAIQDKWARASPMRRLLAPDEVANMIAFLCSAANTTVSGQVIHAGGHSLPDTP